MKKLLLLLILVVQVVADNNTWTTTASAPEPTAIDLLYVSAAASQGKRQYNKLATAEKVAATAK